MALDSDHSPHRPLRRARASASRRRSSCRGSRRGDRAQATFGLLTERRGPVDAGAYEATISDPLGLARRRLSVSRPARCIVLPHIEPLTTVVPEVRGWLAAESTLSVAERLITGSSMLRRYAQGDDFRRVHWRTTARVGELMVRDGGDRDEPDRIATTVLLDVGDGATPVDELDRAVEVAASVLSARSRRVEHRSLRRLPPFDDDESGHRWSAGARESPERAHCPLRHCCSAHTGASAVQRRRRAARPARPTTRCSSSSALSGNAHRIQSVLEDLARAYSAVVLVLVGAASPSTRDELEARWQADDDAGSRAVSETGPRYPQGRVGRSRSGVLTVPLPLGRALAAAWSLDLEGPDLVDEVTGWSGGAMEVAR